MDRREATKQSDPDTSASRASGLLRIGSAAGVLTALASAPIALATETLPPIPAAAAAEENSSVQSEPELEVESFYTEPIRENPYIGPFGHYPASEMLKQVAERMHSFYNFNDPPTNLHENIHFLHGYLRQTYGELPEYRDEEVRYEGDIRITSNAVQPIWLGDGMVAMVKDPDSLVLDDILAYVPESLQRSRTRIYLQNDPQHRETNILNEHAAYLLDAEYSVKIHDYIWENYQNSPERHVIDAADGAAEFVAYTLALGQAIENSTDNFETLEDKQQALAAIKTLCERSAAVYKEALNIERYPMFTATDRDYLTTLRDSPDAESLRNFAIETFGEAWFQDLVAE